MKKIKIIDFLNSGVYENEVGLECNHNSISIRIKIDNAQSLYDIKDTLDKNIVFIKSEHFLRARISLDRLLEEEPYFYMGENC